MRFIPIAGFMLLVVLLGYLLITKPTTTETQASDYTPLPNFALTALDGKAKWEPQALIGHVTLVNFFASWCAPCEAEMPELVALKKQFPNVVFEGVAWNDEPATITKWLNKHGNPFSKLWIDPNGDATIALGLKGIPETLILDAHGTIRYRLSGPVTKSRRATDIDDLLKQLQEEAKNAE